MATQIGPIGVNSDIIPTLAKEAAGQWTAQFNPVDAGEGEMAALYQAAV